MMVSFLLPRLRSFSFALLTACLTATAPSSLARAADPQPAPSRIVAFGDVHGAYDELIAVLRAAGVIDEALAWQAGSTHVVSVGDLVDRGADSRRVLDLLMRLEQEAGTAGGALHVVAGNHEIMNLMGDLRYLAQGELAAFISDESQELRARMLEEYASLPDNAAAPPETIAASFDKRFPPGWFAHRRAFSRDGRYGRWLLARPALVVLGDTAFVHGGVPPAVAELGLAGTNARYRENLEDYFRAVATLESGGVFTQFDDANERVRKAAAWLATGASDALLRTAAEQLIALDEQSLLGPEGPLWYRGTALCHAVTELPITRAALEALAVRRVAMGHTPTPGGRIYQRFDGRALRIDTGMNRAVYHGRPAALVIEPARIYANYVDAPKSEANLEPYPSYAGGERLGLAEAELLAALATAPVSARDAAGPDTLALTLDVDGRKLTAEYRWLRGRAIDRELAAYRLDRLLEIGLVPPTIAREIDGRPGLLQLRPGRIASLAELQAAGHGPAGGWCALGPQYQLLYAFDTLILNEQRSPQTILYDTDAWMVLAAHHDSSFGTARRLPRQLANAELVALPELLERIEALTPEQLEETLSDLLSKREIRAILERASLLPRGASREAVASRR